MEYLQPLKILESKVALYRNLLAVSAFLLATAMVIVPMTTLEGNPVIVRSADSVSLAKKEPWKLSITRIEDFLNRYLASRFDWNEVTFGEKRDNLKSIVAEGVFVKLKDSLAAFESLNKSQKARSYYVLEGFAFANEKHQIEAHISRVLRIGKLALATPLVIQIEYRDVAITESNPYGLQISALSESEVN